MEPDNAFEAQLAGVKRRLQDAMSAPVRKPAESAGLEFPIDTVFRTARRLAEPWTTKCLPAALLAHVDDPEEHPKEGRMACA